MMLSGYCNYVTAIAILLLLVVHISRVESRNLRIQKRFTREDVCKETLKTGKTVYNCPVNEESARIRSNETKCENIHDSCSQDPLVYHCVRSGNKLIEVCAPRNYITGKCCVQFNEGLGRIVEDYSISCSECPFHYYSNESITYPTCFQSIISMAVHQTTIQSTEEEVTSKSVTTVKPSTTSTSTIRKTCKSATGRRKRSHNRNCEENASSTIPDYILLNETEEAKNKNTRHKGDAVFTIVFVTLTVFILIGIGAVWVFFKEFFTYMETPPLAGGELQILTYTRHSGSLSNEGSFFVPATTCTATRDLGLYGLIRRTGLHVHKISNILSHPMVPVGRK